MYFMNGPRLTSPFKRHMKAAVSSRLVFDPHFHCWLEDWPFAFEFAVVISWSTSLFIISSNLAMPRSSSSHTICFDYQWRISGFCHVRTHLLSPRFSDVDGRHTGIQFQLKMIPSDCFNGEEKTTAILLRMPVANRVELDIHYRISIVNCQNQYRRTKRM